MIPSDLDQRVRKAVRLFWSTRRDQATRQGKVTGVRDTGARAAVTGGAQMNGFVELTRSVLLKCGVPEPDIYCRKSVELPGWFRPEKSWDLIVVSNRHLLAAIEFKSQIGPSFGNNFNNRSEEAIGNATDLLAAYREGAFSPSPRPWLGYLMLLEESPASTRPVRVAEPHFKTFREFNGASYARRYELLITKLLRDRLYDAGALVLSDRASGPMGGYREPSPELTIELFLRSLMARALAGTPHRAPPSKKGPAQ